MTTSNEASGKTPWCAEDVTVEWLNEVLGTHDDFRDSKITSFEMELISEGIGFVGEAWRLRLDFESQTLPSPETVVAKFASRNRQRKARLRERTVREANVYRYLGTKSEFIMPRCYFSDSDPDTGDCNILTEDLRRGRPADNIAGLSEVDAKAVTRAISVFHAYWWGRTDKAHTRWLPTQVDQATYLRGNYLVSMPRFLELFSEQINDGFRTAVTLFGEKLIPVFEAASRPPLTVRHGDFRPDNIFFDTEFRGSAVTLLDWQLSERGKGAADISLLTTLGLDIGLRRSIDDGLLRIYQETLVSKGVTDYGLDECRADYQQGILTAMRPLVVAGANANVGSGPGQTFMNTMISRTSAAVEDYDIVGLLREI